MKFWNVCIDRPVLATVLSLVVMLVGLVSLTRLQNREYPDVDPPLVSVTTVLPGAAPEVIETSVTQPLEDQLVGISGVRHITSVSSEEVSRITVEFELSQNVDLAANDVRDRVARARRLLNSDVEEPIVSKQDADAQPIMWFALSGEDHDQIYISTVAESQIRDRLSKLPGVSSVILGGERRMSMRVWIDNVKLTGHLLTVSEVAAALRRQNVDIPSGRVEGDQTEFSVRTLGELKTPEEYGALIIAEVNEGLIRLRDIARVEIGPETVRKLVHFNQLPAVGLGVVKQSNANTLDVARALKAEVAAIRPTLPPGLDLEIAFDSSIYVERALTDVRQTILEAIILVVIIIFLFLGSLRATVIPAAAIPVSIIGAFSVLYYLDFSVNTLTMMGLTLAIGLVVDDAIVVLENITRWIEGGTEPRRAAHKGMDQIAFAVIASTISILAVFLPLAFLTDKTGRLFREFGITVAAAVAISGFVALTLSPMLCARVLRRSRDQGGFKKAFAKGVERMAARYEIALRAALAHRSVVLIAGIAWVGLGLFALNTISREFIPTADRSAVVTIMQAPEGSTIDYTARYMNQAEDILFETPEVMRSFAVVAPGLGGPGRVSEAAMFTSLVPWEDRDRVQHEIVDDLRERMQKIPGLQAFPINISAFGGSMSSAVISLVVQGPDVNQLSTYADEIVERLSEVPGLVNVRADLEVNKPQLEIDIDRNRASDLGVSVREIATTLQILVGGLELSEFKLGGETYQVIGRLEATGRASPRDLYQLNIRSETGEMISLASVARIREAVTPRGLPHFDRQRSATITASLLDGYGLGSALDQVRVVADEVLPAGQGYQAVFSGESEDFYESGNALFFAYLLAIVIVYLTLAAQFESFLDPITILVAVALSFTGALVTLIAVGETLNLFSQIGLVMLVGIVTKNSILIIEFANQLQESGRDLLEATVESARTRFRPILMTATSTIVGILPIALGFGAGGETRASLGVAVAGGMLFSTLLTFFVVPAVHLSLARSRQKAPVAPTIPNTVPPPA
ncbi:MAG: efflux RND transporter permease subunit [Candidatus Binatia bacterium]|nr:efflux RND transporter permease subunit [Candidatus Binatia bacterium]